MRAGGGTLLNCSRIRPFLPDAVQGLRFRGAGVGYRASPREHRNVSNVSNMRRRCSNPHGASLLQRLATRGAPLEGCAPHTQHVKLRIVSHQPARPRQR